MHAKYCFLIYFTAKHLRQELDQLKSLNKRLVDRNEVLETKLDLSVRDNQILTMVSSETTKTLAIDNEDDKIRYQLDLNSYSKTMFAKKIRLQIRETESKHREEIEVLNGQL